MNKSGYKARTRAASVLIWILILAGGVIIVAPLGIMVFGSFKDVKEAAQMNLALPSVWHPENFLIVFNQGNLGRSMLNSTIITVSTVIITVLTATMASFYMARCDSRLSRVMFSGFMLGMIAPVSLIPTILVLQKLRLNNSFLGVILIFSALNMAFTILLCSGFIKTIPRQIDEAAIIDGCGPLRTFFLIVFPLLLPVIVTAVIIVFMSVWNNFVIPLYFLSDSSKWPMPLSVYNFYGKFQSSWNLVFADLLMTALPILCVYLLGQKYIIDGMTAGAVKG